jgi:putative serine protease PepD
LRKYWPLIAAAVVLGLGAGVAGGAAYREFREGPGACDATGVAAKAGPALVGLLAAPGGTPYATGIVIQADGVILAPATSTSAAGGTALVQLPNGEQADATVVGVDPLYGLQVLRLARTNLPALLLSWNNDLAVGAPTVVLGSAANPSASLAPATVSALNLTIETTAADGSSGSRTDVIRFDNGFSDALSGGAVVNCDGQLVAIAMAVPHTGNSTSAPTAGYALAATTARRISQEILSGSPVTHAWVGADVTAVSPDLGTAYRSSAGMLIRAVEPGGPAAMAGLKVGDVITAVDGQAANSRTWSRWLLTATVGDHVRIDYARSGSAAQAQLTVIDQPAQAVLR